MTAKEIDTALRAVRECDPATLEVFSTYWLPQTAPLTPSTIEASLCATGPAGLKARYDLGPWQITLRLHADLELGTRWFAWQVCVGREGMPRPVSCLVTDLLEDAVTAFRLWATRYRGLSA